MTSSKSLPNGLGWLTEAGALLKRLGGAEGQVKARIAAAAARAGLSETRTFDLWYGKARRVEAHERAAILTAIAEQTIADEKNEHHQLAIRLVLARPTPAWTEERTQELRSHIRSGLSDRQIADAMGITKNAVIGKRHRLELENSYGTPWSEYDFKRLRVMIETRLMTPAAAAIALGRSPDAIRSQCRKLGIKWRRLEPNRKIKRTKTIGNDSGGMAVKIIARHGDHIHHEGDGRNDLRYTDFDIARVSIADLEPHHCRWPIGNPKSDTFGYCGCQRENALTPYCEEHHKRASNGRVRAIDLMRG